MKFTSIINDLQSIIEQYKDTLKTIKNQYRIYTELIRLANIVGDKYNINIQLNFPYPEKLKDYDSYGKENITIVIDKHRKQFPISRDMIKDKAKEIFNDVNIKDAYMYEGKEGVKIFFNDGRIDILPGSLHIWRKIDSKVEEFCNWLFDECYKL
ncbi:MAG: hypothetical protein D6752_06580 [Candidatus Nitrosothermus koennekii]|nr:MAG: hypothetical protein D6752_06580 [Candidatus Nitrosothermus koennekii]